MSYLDRLDDRIAELGRLEAGWDSYGSKTIDPAAIAWLREVREASATGLIKHPLYFYPCADGGAHIEFDTGPYCVSATFDPKTKLVDFGATCVGLPTVEDIDATVSTVPELADLIRKVCQLAAASFTAVSQ